MIIVTTETVPGHTVERAVGHVQAMRSTTEKRFKDMFTNVDIRAQRAHSEVMDDVSKQAETLGANAIIDLKVTSRFSGWGGVYHVHVHGTAVVIS